MRRLGMPSALSDGMPCGLLATVCAIVRPLELQITFDALLRRQGAIKTHPA